MKNSTVVYRATALSAVLVLTVTMSGAPQGSRGASSGRRDDSLIRRVINKVFPGRDAGKKIKPNDDFPKPPFPCQTQPC